MLGIFVRNSRLVQSTGISFAAIGTTMHVLNVANMMTPSVSHTWSAIAILGFFLTAGSQTQGLLAGRMARTRRLRTGSRNSARNDVALP